VTRRELEDLGVGRGDRVVERFDASGGMRWSYSDDLEDRHVDIRDIDVFAASSKFILVELVSGRYRMNSS